MNVIEMIDSIESPATTGHPIPQAILNAPAIAGYIAGNSWPTDHPYELARPDLAKAGRIVSITLTANAAARCLDIESGGATVGEAPGWLRSLADHTHGKPILYTSASNVNQLNTTMQAAGIPRDAYLIWSAHYTHVPHICAPNVCGFPPADGTQWTDRIAENCDASRMADYCFTTTPEPLLEEDMITAILKRDGRIEVFVEKAKTGEVFHAYQTTENGGWDGAQAGVRNAQWHSLGVPS